MPERHGKVVNKAVQQLSSLTSHGPTKLAHSGARQRTCDLTSRGANKSEMAYLSVRHTNVLRGEAGIGGSSLAMISKQATISASERLTCVIVETSVHGTSMVAVV